MKRTDLEKLKGLKIAGKMKEATLRSRLGNDAKIADSRREQRRLDQARGLVPFAVKIDGRLANRVRALAEERGVPLNDVVTELLEKALER